MNKNNTIYELIRCREVLKSFMRIKVFTAKNELFGGGRGQSDAVLLTAYKASDKWCPQFAY